MKGENTGMSDRNDFHDFRTKPTSELTFYAIDDLRAQFKGKSFQIFRFDTIQQAIDKYNEFDKSLTSAIGGSIHGTHEIDFVHQYNGEPALVCDYKNTNYWRNAPQAQAAIKTVVDTLEIKWQMDNIGRALVLTPNSFYFPSTHDNYLNNLSLIPFKNFDKACDRFVSEVYIDGEGWKSGRWLEEQENLRNPGNSDKVYKVLRLNAHCVNELGYSCEPDIDVYNYKILRERNKIELSRNTKSIFDRSDFRPMARELNVTLSRVAPDLLHDVEEKPSSWQIPGYDDSRTDTITAELFDGKWDKYINKLSTALSSEKNIYEINHVKKQLLRLRFLAEASGHNMDLSTKMNYISALKTSNERNSHTESIPIQQTNEKNAMEK